ncbi:MAG: hypothetical protein QOH88_3597 [Verrucomicrobiota bacterium]
MLIGYRFKSMMKLLTMPERARGFPLIMRGDSHRLATSLARGQKSEVRGPNLEGGGQISPVASQGSVIKQLKEAAKRLAITVVYNRFAAFLYVGQANREYFRIHGVPDSKLFFSPHAVDNERFMAEPDKTHAAGVAWRAELGIPKDYLVVMFAGKFEAKKRPLALLAAFQHLDRKDVSLLFVGSGALEPQLREKAGSASNVFFAPFQNQSQMPRTYAACDLFVLPSFGPNETWGLAINEALCLKKPVIVSDHVGCAADLVHTRINGWVFPAGRLDALTSTVEEALADRCRLQKFGEAGFEIVKEYNYARASAGLEAALEALSARK